jgi:hypothetical protein
MADETPNPEVVAETQAPTPEVTSTEKPFVHTDVPSLLAIGDKNVPAEKPEAAAPEAPVVAEVSATTPEKVETEVKPEEAKVEEAKPGEVKPEVKPEEVKVEVAPVEYKFTPPEGATIDEAKITPYVDILKENNISPEVGQKLFDMHYQAIQEINNSVLADQHRAFADFRKEQQAKIMSDPELGGSGFKTVEAAVARMRDRFVPQKHYQEFNDFLNVTGAGEHPALWRLLNNVAKAFDEPAPTPAGGTPPPNHGKPPSRKGIKSLYTNPTSNS